MDKGGKKTRYGKGGLLQGIEKSEEVGIDVVGDLEEISGVLLEVACVAIDDDEVALVVVDPFLITAVKASEVVERHGLLVVASALVNMIDKVGQRTADVDHQVGQASESDHGVKEVAVVIEVTVGHHAHVVEIGGEDARILEDGAILHDGGFRFGYLDYLFEALGEEVDLDIERPTRHVGVVVGEVGIVVNRFEARRPAVALGEHLGECGFAATDVACYCNVHRVMC